MSTLSELEEQIRLNKFNPHNIQYVSLDLLSQSSNGTLVPGDGTTPFIRLLEQSSVACAVSNSEIDMVARRIDPQNAKSHQELTRHLNYNELNLIYAKPGTVPFLLDISVSDLIKYATKVDNTTSRVVIPEDTVFQHSDGTKFGIYYAIEINITNGTAIDAKYILNDTPLAEFGNPIIEVGYRQPEDVGSGVSELLLELKLDVYQFNRTEYSEAVNLATGFKKSYSITDQLYYTRVYSKIDDSWVELDTVFSEFIYNPTSLNATAVINLDGSKLSVEIPQVYLTRGLVGPQVKIVVYSTKGDISTDFSLSTIDDFSVNFINNDATLLDYAAPLLSINNVIVFSRDTITGGYDTPELEELKATVINGSLGGDPITERNLEFVLDSKGYNTIHELDYVSDNLYLASERLTFTYLDTDVQVASGNLEIYLDDLSDVYNAVTDIPSQVLITPGCIMEYVDGVVNLLNTSEANLLLSQDTESLIASLNDNSYLMTPFYYLVEYTDQSAFVNPFNLDTPTIDGREYLGNNTLTDGLISTNSISVTKTATGYDVSIIAGVNEVNKELPDDSFIAQLSYKDDVGLMFSVNSTNVGRTEDGYFEFLFTLSTNYNLSREETLELTTVSHTNSGDYLVANLLSTFNLTYNLISNLPPSVDDTFKEYTDGTKLPNEYQTLSREAITIKFGEKLDYLYNSNKVLSGIQNYKRYSEDVFAYYETDIYETDETGHLVSSPNPAWETDKTKPPRLYNLLYTEGSPILDDDDLPVLLHSKGDLVIDEVTGSPIVVGLANYTIRTNMVMIDLKYELGSDDGIDILRDGIISNINNDIIPLDNDMLELSKLEYSVTNNLGLIPVRFNSNTEGSINAELEFTVDINVDAVTYTDINIRTSIVNNVKTAIFSYVGGSSFAMDELTANIAAVLGDTIMSFRVSTVGGRSDVIGYTLINPNDIIGVRIIADKMLDGSIGIVDDIKINFHIG